MDVRGWLTQDFECLDAMYEVGKVLGFQRPADWKLDHVMGVVEEVGKMLDVLTRSELK